MGVVSERMATKVIRAAEIEEAMRVALDTGGEPEIEGAA
jgi:hypothetical protein